MLRIAPSYVPVSADVSLHVGTQKGTWSSQGCPREGGGQSPREPGVPPWPAWTGTHLPRAGEEAKPTFPTGTDAVWGYDMFSCSSGSCCLVLPRCRGNSVPRYSEASPFRDLSWSAGWIHSAVRSSHLLGFPGPLFSPRLFLAFLCRCRNLAEDPGARVWWAMGNVHCALSPGTCLTHRHHIPTAPMVSLLEPGSKSSHQKINHHICLKMHFFARFVPPLSHR